MILRDKYLKMLNLRMHNGLVKIITGIRRSGKSYLLNEIFYNHLLDCGIKEKNIIRFAFDSAIDLVHIGENVYTLKKNKQKINPEKFIKYIDEKIDNDKDEYYLLLDEVQNMECFETVLNGYLRKKNIDIYVTGSNSRFLSKDVLTEFAGRGDEIHILPLSFSEFYAFCKNKEYALDDYMVYGGLPMAALMETDEQKINYLKTQIQNVYVKDLVFRNNLKDDNAINELLDVMASGISTLTNATKLSNTFKSNENIKISPQTINNYIDYMEDAFIISRAKRFDLKGKKYINTPYKIYFEDVGLRNARLNFRQVENTHIMENIIYNELRYRNYNVDVGVVEARETKDYKTSRKQFEVDFVANLGSKRYYIQSAYDIPNEEKLSKELKSFDYIDDSFKKIIVVEKNIKPRRNEKGYLFLGLKDFLLNQDSLEI